MHRWKTNLIGSIYGASPRWKDYGLIAVHMVKMNIFLFNFDSVDGRNRAVSEGLYTFNKKRYKSAPDASQQKE